MGHRLEDMSAPARLAGPEEGISAQELALAARNHGLPLEALRYEVTPPGLHYVLTHYDIPYAEEASWRLALGGRVRRPLLLGVDELKAYPAVRQRVTMECAGNGRALLMPRPVSQPWLVEAVGTAEWTGVPLRVLLAEAGSDRTRWTWCSPARITASSAASSRTTGVPFRWTWRGATSPRSWWRTR